MNRTARCGFLALLLLAAPAIARADRDLSIDAVSINGFTAREIRVRPGERLSGNVSVTTNSSSVFRTHTAVWLPSWKKDPSAMRVFLKSIGGVDHAVAPIDIVAPDTLGAHYLLFCFDRKGPAEMYQEILLRTDEQIYASGRAVKIVVDTAATPAPMPPPDTVVYVEVGAAPRTATAGFGKEREAVLQVPVRGLDSGRDDAIRISVIADNPVVDLDFEVLDAAGHRRGASEAEGGASESAIVRIHENEMLSVRVYAFKRGEESPFRISAERVSLAASRHDPSAGAAVPAGDYFSAQGRAGSSFSTSAWYVVPLARTGSIRAEARGEEPAKDLDLWIYDDLGNPRGTSREDGSRLESAVVDPAESAVYYVRVGAFQKKDESPFAITMRVEGGGVPATRPVAPPLEAPRSFDTGQKPPVPFEIARGKDYDGFVHVVGESSFMIEVYTGWGDVGKIDLISVAAPDGSALWEKRAEGRGWEGERIRTKGPGYYRIHLSYSGDGSRKGRIDLDGLSDLMIYKVGPRADLGEGGPGLDAAEKAFLKTLYDMMAARGAGISPEEAELLKRLEEYFTAN